MITPAFRSSRGTILAALLSIAVLYAPNTAMAEEPSADARDALAKSVFQGAELYIKPLVDRGWAHAIVVGVVDSRGSQVVGFGRRTADKPEPPDGDSLFEIGSVTKVFTGTLLADMAERGLLAIDDPANKFLPEDIKELQTQDHAMRLVDLATHSSGLPRMPTNWQPKDSTDPFVDYTNEKLYECLKQHAAPSLGKSLGKLLGTQPKTQWEYSNLGVGLLGHLLERKAGQPYEQLLEERICRPLGMQSTRLVLDDAVTARLIAGHDSDGNAEKNWHFACLAPCGGLRSSVNDLLKFVSANMGLTDTPLKAACLLAQQPRYELNAKSSVGLNWFVRGDLVFHDGMTGGYSSFVGFSKSKRLGVVVLADTTVGGTSGLLNQASLALVKSLIGEPPAEPPVVRAAVAVDTARLAQYVGSYSLVPLIATFTITSEEDKLLAQLTGQPRFRIFPESDSRFFYRVVDAQIEFERDDSGNVTALLLHQGGKDMKAGRLKEKPQDDVKPEPEKKD